MYYQNVMNEKSLLIGNPKNGSKRIPYEETTPSKEIFQEANFCAHEVSGFLKNHFDKVSPLKKVSFHIKNQEVKNMFLRITS